MRLRAPGRFMEHTVHSETIGHHNKCTTCHKRATQSTQPLLHMVLDHGKSIQVRKRMVSSLPPHSSSSCVMSTSVRELWRREKKSDKAKCTHRVDESSKRWDECALERRDGIGCHRERCQFDCFVRNRVDLWCAEIETNRIHSSVWPGSGAQKITASETQRISLECATL